jgi:hypothetical protein
MGATPQEVAIVLVVEHVRRDAVKVHQRPLALPGRAVALCELALCPPKGVCSLERDEVGVVCQL